MPLAVLATVTLLCSCALAQTDQPIQVLLPPPPAGWQIAFPGLVFRVSSRDASGARVEVDAALWHEPVGLTCARSPNVPILAWPWVPAGERSGGVPPGSLRPAGGAFPRCLRDWKGRTVVELSWEEGPAALVLDRAAAQGADLARFNAARLFGYLGKRSDPWKVDLDKAAQRIAEGTFTAWDLDDLPVKDVSLDTGPGTWFLEDPLEPPAGAEGGAVSFGAVAVGAHRLFSLAGAVWRVQVAEGEVMLMPGP